jgi:hypothetical protein
MIYTYRMSQYLVSVLLSLLVFGTLSHSERAWPEEHFTDGIVAPSREDSAAAEKSFSYYTLYSEKKDSRHVPGDLLSTQRASRSQANAGYRVADLISIVRDTKTNLVWTYPQPINVDAFGSNLPLTQEAADAFCKQFHDNLRAPSPEEWRNAFSKNIFEGKDLINTYILPESNPLKTATKRLLDYKMQRAHRSTIHKKNESPSQKLKSEEEEARRRDQFLQDEKFIESELKKADMNAMALTMANATLGSQKATEKLTHEERMGRAASGIGYGIACVFNGNEIPQR